jgi:hypothetical protein
MSGYLQRLVSSARAPSGALRPVLGSLFSAPNYQATAEGFQALEETAISRQPEFLATLAAQPPRAIQPGSEPSPTPSDLPYVQTQTPTAQATVRREDSRPTSEARDSFKPLLTQVSLPSGSKLNGVDLRPTSEARESFKPLLTQVSLPSGSKLQPPGERGLREKLIGSAEPSPEGSDQDVRLGTTFKDREERVDLRLERPEQQGILQRPYSPLVAEGLSRIDARPPRNWSSLTSDGRRTEKTDLPPRVARPEREEDEIQIHIGRIEVTAVPPAPARPAAQPIRKSLRLDEYLRRGRERAL